MLNILLSFAYHTKTDLHAAKRRLRGNGLLMLDSGAFTVHSTGKEIKLDEYAAFLRHWAGAWDSAVTLDVIGDSKATARNTLKLHGMGLPVLPVFTFGTRMAELDAMAKDNPYICVGGTVGYTKQRSALTDYLAAVRRRAASHGCSIHTLGVGSLPTITAVRPFTSDSSRASGAPTYGSVLVWDGERLRTVHPDEATRFAVHLRRHGVHPGIVASGRAWEPARRINTGAAGFLAVARADEHLKRLYRSPAPSQFPAGPHLFSATARDRVTEWGSIEQAASMLDGPHMFSATNGDRNSYEWPAIASAADSLADGPHLYAAAVPGGWVEDAITAAVRRNTPHEAG